MPLYEYECQECKHSFEIKQGYNDPKKRKCPKCQKRQLLRLIFAPHLSIIKGDGEINVGHLGNRHRDTFSADQKERLDRKNLTAKQFKQKKAQENRSPHETKSDKEVKVMDSQQQQDYIING